MFEAFYNDWTYMPNKQFAIKYIYPFIIILVSILLTGQLIVQFISVDHLDKTSGKILDLQTMVTGHQRHRSIPVDTYTPMYSLVIGLDNLNSYNIDNTADRKMLGDILHKGDSVTIYTPTALIKVLSTGLVHPVGQIECKGQVIFSFDNVKKENYVIISFYTVFIILVFFVWRFQKKYSI